MIVVVLAVDIVTKAQAASATAQMNFGSSFLRFPFTAVVGKDLATVLCVEFVLTAKVLECLANQVS